MGDADASQSSLPSMAVEQQQQQQQQQQLQPQLSTSHALRFRHACQFNACPSLSCSLCKNNPNKRCADGCNFGSVYIQGHKIKAKCGSEVSVELVSRATGQAQTLPGVSLQISVIDGSPRHSAKAGLRGSLLDHAKELLVSDQGQELLRANLELCRSDGKGRILLDFPGPSCRLPDLHIEDKTDTFRVEGQTFSSFRLVARAVSCQADGQTIELPHVAPALSSEFTVKSARAVHEFLKPEFLHYKESVTRLKHIGGATAACLTDIQTYIPELPMVSVQTVEQLAKLIRFTDQDQHLQTKLMNVMKSKGIQKQKWSYLRSFLSTSLVFDDDAHRTFFPDAGKAQGLLFACRQGQINIQEPVGLVERVGTHGRTALAVNRPSDPQLVQLMNTWKAQALEAWASPGHPGWSIALDPLEMPHGSHAAPFPRTSTAEAASVVVATPQAAMARQIEQARTAGRPPPLVQTTPRTQAPSSAQSMQPLVTSQSVQPMQPMQPMQALASTTLTITSSVPQDLHHQPSLNVAWQTGVLSSAPVLSPFERSSLDSVISGRANGTLPTLQMVGRTTGSGASPFQSAAGHWDTHRPRSGSWNGDEDGDAPSRMRSGSSSGLLGPLKSLRKVSNVKTVTSVDALQFNRQEALEGHVQQLSATLQMQGEPMAIDAVQLPPAHVRAAMFKWSPFVMPGTQQQPGPGQQQELTRMSDASNGSGSGASATEQLPNLLPNPPGPSGASYLQLPQHMGVATLLPSHRHAPAGASIVMPGSAAVGLAGVMPAGGDAWGADNPAAQPMHAPLQNQAQPWVIMQPAAPGVALQYVQQPVILQQQAPAVALTGLRAGSMQPALAVPMQSVRCSSQSASSGSGQQNAQEEATGQGGTSHADDSWEALLDNVWCLDEEHIHTA